MNNNNMKLLVVSAIVFFMLFGSIAFAALDVSLSDQGTSVTVKSTGNLLPLGNLTIEIYDALTGGTLVYNETFTDAIVNGSWNVMLGEDSLNPLSLEFGKVYYRDYKINGDDVDFTNGTGDTVERQFFYSPLGDVNTSEIANDSIISAKILDGTITDADISDSTNLTLGQKITFSFGEVIDNIEDGWVRVTGGLNVTGDTSVRPDGTTTVTYIQDAYPQLEISKGSSGNLVGQKIDIGGGNVIEDRITYHATNPTTYTKQESTGTTYSHTMAVSQPSASAFQTWDIQTDKLTGNGEFAETVYRSQASDGNPYIEQRFHVYNGTADWFAWMWFETKFPGFYFYGPSEPDVPMYFQEFSDFIFEPNEGTERFRIEDTGITASTSLDIKPDGTNSKLIVKSTSPHVEIGNSTQGTNHRLIIWGNGADKYTQIDGGSTFHLQKGVNNYLTFEPDGELIGETADGRVYWWFDGPEVELNSQGTNTNNPILKLQALTDVGTNNHTPYHYFKARDSSDVYKDAIFAFDPNLPGFNMMPDGTNTRATLTNTEFRVKDNAGTTHSELNPSRIRIVSPTGSATLGDDYIDFADSYWEAGLGNLFNSDGTDNWDFYPTHIDFSLAGNLFTFNGANINFKPDGTNSKLNITNTAVDISAPIDMNSNNIQKVSNISDSGNNDRVEFSTSSPNVKFYGEGAGGFTPSFTFESANFPGYQTAFFTDSNEAWIFVDAGSQNKSVWLGGSIDDYWVSGFDGLGNFSLGYFDTIHFAPDGTNSRMAITNTSADIFVPLDMNNNNITNAGNVCLSDGTNCPVSDEVRAEAILEANTLTTDIPEPNAWVIANASSWESNYLEQITVSSSGVIQYNGSDEILLFGSGHINLLPATGSKLLSVRSALIAEPDFNVTFTNVVNFVNETGTALSNNDTISFKNTLGTLPAELRDDVIYFVVNKETDAFQLSYTEAGSAIEFTDDGTPTNSYSTTTIRGGAPLNVISATDARSIHVSSIVQINTNEEIVLLVSNTEDDTAIDVTSAYFSIHKV